MAGLWGAFEWFLMASDQIKKKLCAHIWGALRLQPAAGRRRGRFAHLWLGGWLWTSPAGLTQNRSKNKPVWPVRPIPEELSLSADSGSFGGGQTRQCFHCCTLQIHDLLNLMFALEGRERRTRFIYRSVALIAARIRSGGWCENRIQVSILAPTMYPVTSKLIRMNFPWRERRGEEREEDLHKAQWQTGDLDPTTWLRSIMRRVKSIAVFDLLSLAQGL